MNSRSKELMRERFDQARIRNAQSNENVFYGAISTEEKISEPKDKIEIWVKSLATIAVISAITWTIKSPEIGNIAFATGVSILFGILICAKWEDFA